ncbi:MAG: hypothetical protein ACKOTZ_12600 [Chloroflexota bacterium]
MDRRPLRPDPTADATAPDLDALMPPADEGAEEMLLSELAWLAAPLGALGLAFVAVAGLLRLLRALAVEAVVATWRGIRGRRPRGGHAAG